MVYKRTCICCGGEYEYCPHCGDYKNQPRWKMNYDDEGCYKAFQTATDYLAGEITKEEAVAILKDVDLKNKDKFVKSVAKVIDEILDEPKPQKILAKSDAEKVDKKDKYQKLDKKYSYKNDLI